MIITSIGLYNPIPINIGSDSYIYSLLNSIGKNYDIIHYYSKLKSQKGRYPNELNFHTKYIVSKTSQKSYQNIRYSTVGASSIEHLQELINILY